MWANLYLSNIVKYFIQPGMLNPQAARPTEVCFPRENPLVTLHRLSTIKVIVS